MPDRQHGGCSSIAHEFGDLAAHNANFLDHGLARSSDPVWHLGSFTIEHQPPPHQCPYSREQPLPGMGSCNDYPQATNFPIPSDAWPPAVPLHAACDNYGNPTIPLMATLYPLSPQHDHFSSTETLDHKEDTERDDELSFLMSPQSPDEAPKSQRKRNRNRLAAAKCRRKAKRGVDDLQQRERDLLRENKMLSAEAGLLRDEVLRLKSEILRHGNCDNDYIHHYIQRAARQVGEQSEDDNRLVPDVPAVS
ncbi:hypothetical protein F4803DRAFT_305725 [Xylaria telfairii]|nr:hypothetical protein F4803DRAFT_305725 [Xylaria telfairii]